MSTHQPNHIEDAYVRKTTLCAVAVMGLAHTVVLHDKKRGIVFMAIGICFFRFLPLLLSAVLNLHLGTVTTRFGTAANSIFALIDGIASLAIICIFLIVYLYSIHDAVTRARNWQNKKNGDDSSFAFIAGGLCLPILLVLFFIIVPLVFSVCIAFTDYAAPDHIPPAHDIHWIGLQNFIRLSSFGSGWGTAFIRVTIWTLCWGFFATIACYVLGMVTAIFLKGIPKKVAKLFHFIFILPYAIPSVLSMIIWQNLLNGSFGIVNRTLLALNLIQTPIPWLSDPLIAKFVCIAVNLWAGFPYFLMLVSGTMTAIPKDMFEAARIDGAGHFQVFSKITFPLVTYQTMPLLIMSFAHNLNNFGAIFFLTGGNPPIADSTLTSAGGTDILVSWIYKLTVNLLKYNYASVLSVCIFAILVPVSVWNFRRTKSFKEGEW